MSSQRTTISASKAAQKQPAPRKLMSVEESRQVLLKHCLMSMPPMQVASNRLPQDRIPQGRGRGTQSSQGPHQARVSRRGAVQKPQAAKTPNQPRPRMNQQQPRNPAASLGYSAAAVQSGNPTPGSFPNLATTAAPAPASVPGLMPSVEPFVFPPPQLCFSNKVAEGMRRGNPTPPPLGFPCSPMVGDFPAAGMMGAWPYGGNLGELNTTPPDSPPDMIDRALWDLYRSAYFAYLGGAPAPTPLPVAAPGVPPLRVPQQPQQQQQFLPRVANGPISSGNMFHQMMTTAAQNPNLPLRAVGGIVANPPRPASIGALFPSPPNARPSCQTRRATNLSHSILADDLFTFGPDGVPSGGEVDLSQASSSDACGGEGYDVSAASIGVATTAAAAAAAAANAGPGQPGDASASSSADLHLPPPPVPSSPARDDGVLPASQAASEQAPDATPDLGPLLAVLSPSAFLPAEEAGQAQAEEGNAEGDLPPVPDSPSALALDTPPEEEPGGGQELEGSGKAAQQEDPAALLSAGMFVPGLEDDWVAEYTALLPLLDAE